MKDSKHKKQTDMIPLGSKLSDYYRGLGDGTKEILGIETGLKTLDKATLGLDGLVILGGVPGMGKTSLSLQLAIGACRLGTPVIFYSLEMTKELLISKALSNLSEIGFTEIRMKGHLLLKECQKDFMRAREELEKISDKFYIRSNEKGENKINFDQVFSDIEDVKKKHNVNKIFVVIDHLQIFDAGEYGNQLDKENKLITGFKEICDKTGSVILIISQKNKAGARKTSLESIKGSVDIVYLADLVMTLEGLNDSLETHSPSREVFLCLVKNRYNFPSTIALHFLSACTLFEDNGIGSFDVTMYDTKKSKKTED